MVLNTHCYLYGPGVARILASENGSGQVLWALSDNQGTVRDLVNSTGTIQNHIVYDSYGNVTSQTNTAVDFRFGYTGREFDEETGQYYYRARYYDAGVGRFISEDPTGFDAGDANLYRYVGNSPINFTDPIGLFVANLVGAGVGAGADLGLQLLTDGGNFSQVNWTSVGVSAASGALGVGLASKAARLTTAIAGRIALNAAGGAVIGAGSQVVANAIEGKCLGDNVSTSALAGGTGAAGGEFVGYLGGRALRGLGGVDDAARAADNAAVGVLDDLGGSGAGNVPSESSSPGEGLPRFTYRGDTRSPEEIFEKGFQPWNPNGSLTLHEHVYGFNNFNIDILRPHQHGIVTVFCR